MSARGKGTAAAAHAAEPVRVDAYLPHRGALLLVDRVRRMGPPLAAAELDVPLGHWAVAGHFPGLPIFPGVLLLEFMAQTGRFLFPEPGTAPALLVRVRHARFLAPVHPPARLVAMASLEGEVGPQFQIRCEAVDEHAPPEGRVVARARFTVLRAE